jgi:predicted Zn-dependent protease
VLTKATRFRWWRPTASGAGALALALTISACSSIPGGRQIFLPDLPKNGETNAPSVREHQRVLSAYGGVYDDPKLQAKLTTVIGRLVASSDRPDLTYKITILNSPAVNAFALPNGQLYVTRGLLALSNDSAEVASVMAHEMAHVIARHAATREEQARKTELISNVNDALGESQVGAMALARSKIALASFSRSQETEADSIGVGIAARAGFDPYGASRLLASMGRNAEMRASGRDTRSLDFMSSHPATPDRVKNAAISARNLGAAGVRHRDKQAYLASIDGMKYGDDTDEGFIRGRQFVHPKLGFTFMAPEGFVLDNTAQAVLGSKESAGQALRLDVVKVPADRSLVEYLNSGWIENIEDNSVEEISINGNQAATAIASGDPWGFRLYVVRFGSEVYRFIFAARNRTPDADRSFRESIQTFHRLSPQESKSAKPLHLKVVRVLPGDTVASIAGGMASADHQAERFQVLNGLDPLEELKPGDLVKIVVE